jgi:chromate transport protein ChrA
MVGLTQLAAVFTRHANLTLGGGSATAATLHRELVQKRCWLTEEQFTLCFALGRTTPGTNLLAYCTGFGWVLRQTPGAVTALLASSIPCAIIVAALTAFFDYWQATRSPRRPFMALSRLPSALRSKRAGPLPNPTTRAPDGCGLCWPEARRSRSISGRASHPFTC